MATRYYFIASKEVAIFLDALFKVAFPKEHKRYAEAFKAGRWECSDPGPWLGRAIVWKLQVLPHRDGLDGGPTAIWNMGIYTGGELYLPDLGLKLRPVIQYYTLILFYLLGIADISRGMLLFC